MLTQFWTDYPFEELGDALNRKATIRQIEILQYDGNKYCRIKFCENEFQAVIKSGYIYPEPIRSHQVKEHHHREVRKYINKLFFKSPLLYECPLS